MLKKQPAVAITDNQVRAQPASTNHHAAQPDALSMILIHVMHWTWNDPQY
jgi:hypothetical protein